MEALRQALQSTATADTAETGAPVSAPARPTAAGGVSAGGRRPRKPKPVE